MTWAKRGIPPFTGPVDDWPAGRSHWLDVVWRLLDETVAEKHPEPSRVAALDAAMADAKRKAGQVP